MTKTMILNYLLTHADFFAFAVNERKGNKTELRAYVYRRSDLVARINANRGTDVLRADSDGAPKVMKHSEQAFRMAFGNPWFNLATGLTDYDELDTTNATRKGMEKSEAWERKVVDAWNAMRPFDGMRWTGADDGCTYDGITKDGTTLEIKGQKGRMGKA